MNVICLEDAALYVLVDQVAAKLREKYSAEKVKWISDDKAMEALNIKSRTTLQKLRDEGNIRFSQPQKKIILYDRQSIDEYLDKNAHQTF